MDPFEKLWREASAIAHAATAKCLPPAIEVFCPEPHQEILEYARLKTKYQAHEDYQAGELQTVYLLARFIEQRMKTEAWARQPLAVPLLNTWLAKLDRRHRQVLQLEYEYGRRAREDAKLDFLRAFLGLKDVAAAQQRLTEARMALAALIDQEGFSPMAWMDPSVS